MCKKIFVTTLVVVGVLVGASYWRAHESSPERRIERLEGKLDQMQESINEVFSQMSRADVELVKLNNEVKRLETVAHEQKTKVLFLREKLVGNPQFISIGGKDFTAEQGKTKLSREFKVFQQNKTKLESTLGLVAKQTEYRERLQDKVEQLIAKKKNYESRLVQLKTSLLELRMEKMRRKDHNVDECKIEKEIERDLSKLEEDVKVERGALKYQEQYQPEMFKKDVPTSTPENDILKQVDEEFKTREVAGDN